MVFVESAEPSSRQERIESIQTGGAAPALRILLLISNLEYGGAQRQVVLLTNHLNGIGVETHVACLSGYVPLSRELRDADRFLHIVQKRSKFDVTVVSRLARLLRELDVNIVHTFLLDSEIAGRLACRRIPHVAVIGSERNTDYKRKWRQTLALRWTQHRLDAVIANSNAGMRFQKKTLGIDDERLHVVHNGVDTARFSPGSNAALRRELGIPDRAGVVGMFASFKKQKNHLMFFRAAVRIRRDHPETHFLCVGRELHGGLQSSDRYMDEMKEAIVSMGLGDAMHLLGNRDDMCDVYQACDVTALTSVREGTPNVLLESMACGVPVVATDISDNHLVVPEGRSGHVVPLEDDEGMARRVAHLLGEASARQAMGDEARRWVEAEFSVDALARKTVKVYREVLARRCRGQA